MNKAFIQLIEVYLQESN